ncbi:hypothetical protein T265_15377, partial [Opisthorchis viverrini]
YSYPPRLVLTDRIAASLGRPKWLTTSFTKQCIFSVRKPSREMPNVLSLVGKKRPVGTKCHFCRFLKVAVPEEKTVNCFERQTILRYRWCIRTTVSNLLILGVFAQIENCSDDPFCFAQHKCSPAYRCTDDFSPTVDETSAIQFQSLANIPTAHYRIQATPILQYCYSPLSPPITC